MAREARKPDPLLPSVVDILGTPYRLLLSEKDVEFMDVEADDGDGVSFVLEPRTIAEANHIAMALRLAFRRIEQIRDRMTET